MERIFIDVVNMSLTAGIVILAVLLARLLLIRAPKIFSYALWLLVLIRLLCPVSFGSGFSLLGLLAHGADGQGRMEYIAQNFVYEEKTADNAADLEQKNIKDNTDSTWHQTAFQNPEQLVLSVGAWIWLVGVVVLAALSVGATLRLQKKLRQSIPEGKRIYRLRGSGTPFVYGIFCPKIYLPEDLAEEEKSYILLHEQIHIRRGDQIFRLLGYAALVIHWFNPLVWLAFWLSGRDMEMSCDEAVIRRMGSDVKKPYSRSLLELACGGHGVKLLPLAFGEGDTKGRIKNILRYRKPAKALVSALIVLCVILGLALLSNPRNPASEEAADAVDIDIDSLAQIDPDDEDAKQEQAEQWLSDKTQEQAEQSEEVTDLTWAKLAENEQLNGTYRVYIRSLSRSAGGIDTYVLDDADGEELPFLAFGEDCQYYVNQEMASVRYEAVSFAEFADDVAGGLAYLNVPCTAVFTDGIITAVYLDSAWYAYGISYEPVSEYGKVWEYEGIGQYTIPQMTDEEALDAYYSLVKTQQADVCDEAGTETIEVYTGNIGDGDSGLVLVKNAQGKLLYADGAHSSRAGWNNIYLGEKDGTPYLLTLKLEDRDTYGEYRYQVFRLDEDGQVRQIAGSDFQFDDERIAYDEALFHQWMDMLNSYLENCQLLLSSQEGELRTEQNAPAESYNYDTLRRE
jgi:beta-lactamase regulating signal transducer with metallopeptidase domain